MGISLVNQEPVQIPPSRFKQLSDDDSTCPKSVDRSGKTTPPKTVCIITEYLEQGSLADILYGPSRLPSNIWTYELVLTCAVQAARGMLYLHSHQPPICHRDLKSSNLVVDDHWVVKVTDFGMSRIIPEKVQDMDKQAHYESDGFNSDDNGRSTIGRNTQFILSGGRPTTISPEMTSNMGTTAWCAPEVLTSSSRTYYSVKVDVYSFGVVSIC